MEGMRTRDVHTWGWKNSADGDGRNESKHITYRVSRCRGRGTTCSGMGTRTRGLLLCVRCGNEAACAAKKSVDGLHTTDAGLTRGIEGRGVTSSRKGSDNVHQVE